MKIILDFDWSKVILKKFEDLNANKYPETRYRIDASPGWEYDDSEGRPYRVGAADGLHLYDCCNSELIYGNSLNYLRVKKSLFSGEYEQSYE